ncbi:MAG: histidine phosphatase family protein [Anaerovoracaceae bacterium]
MKITINLIRHGVTEGNQKKWYYGDTDLPLTNEGIDQLVEFTQKGIYPSADNMKLYTSGLTRAEQTFFLIYGPLEHKIIEGLREYKFGEFEQKSYEDLKDIPEYIKWIEDTELDYEVPGGESISQFDKRVNDTFAKLVGMGNSAIVVCHGGVISAIMQRLFPKQKEHIFAWIPSPGRGYALDFEDGVPVEFREI